MSVDGFMCYNFMDDSTLTEACDNPLESTMQDAADQLTDWSNENHTKLNGTKTKEMIITFAKGPPHIPLININGTEVERVKSTKLLGVIISDNLKWDLHVNSVCSKAGSRMHFLNHLSRSGLEPEELVEYYTSIIRSVLENACPAWFTNIIRFRTHVGTGIYSGLSNENHLSKCIMQTSSNSHWTHRLHYLLPEAQNRRLCHVLSF